MKPDHQPRREPGRLQALPAAHADQREIPEQPLEPRRIDPEHPRLARLDPRRPAQQQRQQQVLPAAFSACLRRPPPPAASGASASAAPCRIPIAPRAAAPPCCTCSTSPAGPRAPARPPAPPRHAGRARSSTCSGSAGRSTHAILITSPQGPRRSVAPPAAAPPLCLTTSRPDREHPRRPPLAPRLDPQPDHRPQRVARSPLASARRPGCVQRASAARRACHTSPRSRGARAGPRHAPDAPAATSPEPLAKPLRTWSSAR
jgi:hypothetical protein